MLTAIVLFIVVLGLATQNYILAGLALLVGIVALLCRLYDEGRL